jgi:putative ABC transport system permease protein
VKGVAALNIRQAIRRLVIRPGLAIAVIGMLALGIGATTAIFSLFQQVLLQPLPVPEPGRLVELRVQGSRLVGGRPGMVYNDVNALFSYPMLGDLQEQQDVFGGVAGHADFIANVSGGTDTEAIAGVGAMVSGSYFQTLNLRPALGRLIGPQDAPAVEESPVVVLSYDYWETILGADPGVIGDTLDVNNQILTIIGVAPEGFTGLLTNSRPTVFVPLTLRSLMQPEEDVSGTENRLYNWVYVFARLAPGVSLEQAAARINQRYRAIIAELDAPLVAPYANDAQMEEFLAHGVTLRPAGRGQGADQISASNPLLLLLGATALVLLIVCVNITSLLLARGAARAGELAIRASIGASRGRLIGQLLGESAMFAVVGGLLALPVAFVTLRMLARMVPPRIASQFTPSLNTQALIFAAAAAVGSVVLFGLLPALRASQTDPGKLIKGQSGQPAGGRGLARLRSSLIGVQITLSTVLLILAGLFMLSLSNLSRMNLGLAVDSAMMFAVQPLAHGYEGDRLDAVYARIVEALESQPGVVAVGSSPMPPFGTFGFSGRVVSIDGTPIEGNAGVFRAYPWTGPGFFEAMSIPVLAGRGFTDRDSEPGVAAIVVNRAFLDRFGLGMDVIGQRIEVASAYYSGGSVEIIGVVGDSRLTGIRSDPPPQVFTPRPRGNGAFSSFVFYVRGTLDPGDMTAMVRPLIASIDPNLPVSQLQPLAQQLRGQTNGDHLIATLSAVFAGLATALAAVGVYAVLSYNVGERTRELGLRLALGASPGVLLGMVMRQVGRIAAVSVVIGVAVAIGVGRVSEALLFGVSGDNPVAFGLAIAIISAVALGASFVPAQRASRVAPMEALREQ